MSGPLPLPRPQASARACTSAPTAAQQRATETQALGIRLLSARPVRVVHELLEKPSVLGHHFTPMAAEVNDSRLDSLADALESKPNAMFVKGVQRPNAAQGDDVLLFQQAEYLLGINDTCATDELACAH